MLRFAECGACAGPVPEIAYTNAGQSGRYSWKNRAGSARENIWKTSHARLLTWRLLYVGQFCKQVGMAARRTRAPSHGGQRMTSELNSPEFRGRAGLGRIPLQH